MNTKLIAVLLLCFAIVSMAGPKRRGRIDKGVQEFVGRIETGIMAIGGETTGTQIVLDDLRTIEVLVPPKIDLAKYPGRVRLKGRPKKIQSVERGMREIIEVVSIENLKP